MDVKKWLWVAAVVSTVPPVNAQDFDRDNAGYIIKDYTAAAPMLRRVADGGEVFAQKRLADMYNFGQGVTPNKEEAARLYRLAADQGYAAAQNNLGVMYAKGEGVDQNKMEAAGLFRLAANQGHANAQNNLGNMYETGDGIPQNKAEALRLYRLAAARGNAAAQHRLKTLLADSGTSSNTVGDGNIPTPRSSEGVDCTSSLYNSPPGSYAFEYNVNRIKANGNDRILNKSFGTGGYSDMTFSEAEIKCIDMNIRRYFR